MSNSRFSTNALEIIAAPAVLPDGNGGFAPCPELLTEEEVIRLLRIPQVSKSGNHSNVIANLKRTHGLPCIHICKQPLFPRDAVLKWIEEKLQKEIVT